MAVNQEEFTVQVSCRDRVHIWCYFGISTQYIEKSSPALKTHCLQLYLSTAICTANDCIRSLSAEGVKKTCLYTKLSSEKQVGIGKYTAENGAVVVAIHFPKQLQSLSMGVPYVASRKPTYKNSLERERQIKICRLMPFP